MAKFAVKLFLVLVLTGTNGFCASYLFESGALTVFRRVNSLIAAKQSVVSLRSFHSLQHSFPEDATSYSSSAIQKRFLSGKKAEKSVKVSNPCIDGVFQYGFSEPSILSDFLNAALELNGEQSIEDIQNHDVVAGPDKAITAFIDRVNVKNLPQEVRDRYIRSLNYYNTTILDIEDKATERSVEQAEVRKTH